MSERAEETLSQIRGVVLDCDEGRRRGCATFCCRLIVRLGHEDEPAYDTAGRRKSCVDKNPETGLCIHLDSATERCRIWARRPRVCREYDCNEDPLLQVVLREGFVSLTHLVQARVPLVPGHRPRIPTMDAAGGAKPKADPE